MKLNPKYIALIIGIILLCFLSWCHGRSGAQPENIGNSIKKPDTITPKITQNKADIKVQVDSVPILKALLQNATGRKNYYKQLYKSTYDSLYDLSDSIGKIRLAITKAIKLRQDSAHEAENQANLLMIVNAYNQIGEYQDNEVLFEAKIVQVRDSVKVFQDSIPKVAKSEFKRGKKVGRVQGVLGTLLAELLLFLGFIAL